MAARAYNARLLGSSEVRRQRESFSARTPMRRSLRCRGFSRSSRKGRSNSSAGALQHERRVQRVDLECLLLADGLALPLVRHRALRETAGLGEEILAGAAEPLRELRQLERP